MQSINSLSWWVDLSRLLHCTLLITSFISLRRASPSCPSPQSGAKQLFKLSKSRFLPTKPTWVVDGCRGLALLDNRFITGVWANEYNMTTSGTASFTLKTSYKLDIFDKLHMTSVINILVEFRVVRCRIGLQHVSLRDWPSSRHLCRVHIWNKAYAHVCFIDGCMLCRLCEYIIQPCWNRCKIHSPCSCRRRPWRWISSLQSLVTHMLYVLERNTRFCWALLCTDVVMLLICWYLHQRRQICL
jgi:hypothetical protein